MMFLRIKEVYNTLYCHVHVLWHTLYDISEFDLENTYVLWGGGVQVRVQLVHDFP